MSFIPCIFIFLHFFLLTGLDPPRTRPNNLIPIYLPIIVILKSDAAVARVLNKIQVTPGNFPNFLIMLL